MPQPILLDIELEAIRRFLERVFKSADEDYIDAARRNELGEFETIDDWENAYWGALSSEQLAIRGAMGELNALIEWEVQFVAIKLDDVKMSLHEKRQFIWDMKWDQLCKRINKGYNVDVSSMNSYQEVIEIRRAVNAFKHRQGFRDPRRDPMDESTFPPDRYNIDRNGAIQFTYSARRFLLALWDATGTL